MARVDWEKNSLSEGRDSIMGCDAVHAMWTKVFGKLIIGRDGLAKSHAWMVISKVLSQDSDTQPLPKIPGQLDWHLRR